MLKEERLDTIVSLVNEHEVMMVEQLVAAVGVSAATMRRDLTELARQGRIEKVRGGAVSCHRRMNAEPSYIAKSLLNAEEKKRIARRAAELVGNGEKVALDSGSTCLELSRCLADKTDLGIVTNDLLIALEFAANHNNNSLIFAGGLMRRDYYASYGSFCEEILTRLRTHKVVIATDAVDLKTGLMSYTPDDVRVKQLLLEMSNEIILLCDHTKFLVSAYIYICPLHRISKIITGRELPDAVYRQLRDQGIDVELV